MENNFSKVKFDFSLGHFKISSYLCNVKMIEDIPQIVTQNNYNYVTSKRKEVRYSRKRNFEL